MEASELFRLALMALVLPPLVFLSKRVRRAPGGRQLIGALSFITASYAFAAAEVLGFREILNMLHHLSYGIAGVLVLWGALAMTPLIQGERTPR